MNLILKEGNKELEKLIDHYHNLILKTRPKFKDNKKLVDILLQINNQIADWMYYYNHTNINLDKNSELELIDTILDMINILNSLKEPK